MGDLLDYLGRFLYMLSWTLSLYSVTYVTSEVAKHAKRTKNPLNFDVSITVALGGAMLTAIFFFIITGMSNFVLDSNALQISKIAAGLIVIQSMFVNCNAELFKEVTRKW